MIGYLIILIIKMMQDPAVAPAWVDSVGMWAQFQSTADNMLEGDVGIILLQHFETRAEFNIASDSIIYWMVMGIGGRDLEVYTTWRTIPRGDKSPEARDLAAREKLMKRLRRFHAKLANAIYGELPKLEKPPKKPKAVNPPEPPVKESAEAPLVELCDDVSSEAPVDVVRRGKLKDYFDMEAKESGDKSDSDSDKWLQYCFFAC